MPAIIRDDVYIKKSDEPLVFDNYEQVVSISRSEKLKKSYPYWETYQRLQNRFNDLYEQVRELVLDKKPVSQRLWDEYKEALADFKTAQEIINRDYEKYAE